MTDHSKTGVGSGSGEWRTPPKLYAWLNRRFAFNYDLFASRENCLEVNYSTAEGSFGWSGVQRVQWSNQTGLGVSLNTSTRVFANPPYTHGFVDQAVESMIERRNQADIIVALLPAATETHWFQKLMQVAHLEFLPRRVRFIHPDMVCGPKCTPGEGTHVFGQPGTSPPGGHVVAIFKSDMP